MPQGHRRPDSWHDWIQRHMGYPCCGRLSMPSTITRTPVSRARVLAAYRMQTQRQFSTGSRTTRHHTKGASRPYRSQPQPAKTAALAFWRLLRSRGRQPAHVKTGNLQPHGPLRFTDEAVFVYIFAGMPPDFTARCFEDRIGGSQHHFIRGRADEIGYHCIDTGPDRFPGPVNLFCGSLPG